ncbi:hypothetical protein IQ250_28935 [Pseudanabaenaceae cyanobacterium LEGE 13415]|nr:hypothetical protein [Pseudanabaenaceae cyanobacterium LEGE 13415]
MLKLVTLTTGLGEPVQAQLAQMQPRHLEDFEMLWRGMLLDLNEEDAFWSWAMKERLSNNDDRFEAYAIEYEEVTQGLMWLETQWHRSWLNPNQRLVYVEALASAPWNRQNLDDPPYLKGVGAALLLFARQRSASLGYQGRVGLHSLPAAERFYQRQNMSEYGQDPDKDNLSYFEFGVM